MKRQDIKICEIQITVLRVKIYSNKACVRNKEMF